MLNNLFEDIKSRFRENELVCEKVMDILSLISNKTRFRILCALKEGDFCVNEIVDIIQMGKVSNVSQQLRLLSMANIIESHRDQKKIIYRLKDEKVRKMISFLEENYLKIKKAG
jgi:DNA-binding transcriptional ArsR family regulator